MLQAVGGGSSPCPAFVGVAAGFLKSVAAGAHPATASYTNPALFLQPQPGHPLFSIERGCLGDPIPATTATSARIRTLRSAAPSSSVGGDRPSVLQERQLDANTTTNTTINITAAAAAAAGAAKDVDDDDGAERMFATARALHLRRHRSPASRGLALELLRETLSRRPAWKETDSRFAVDSEAIDEVFRAFQAFPGENDDDGGARNTMVGDISDVRCLRETLSRVGYSARNVQERFGVAGERRLPGPYYLRKSLDHRNVSYTAVVFQHGMVSCCPFFGACECLRLSSLYASDCYTWCSGSFV